MECSVCMESIDCPTKAPCGHAFHFECLFRWGRKKNTCPLCRGELIKIEEEEDEDEILINSGQGGYARSFVADILMNHMHTFRQTVNRQVEQRYRARPIEQYTGEVPDPLDVQLVANQTGASHEKARLFLKYFQGDIVDTILFLTTTANGEFAIPPYVERNLPRPEEPYVPRHHKERMVYEGRVTGYESS
jgi:NACalpha-BTF3-like transcription factor